MKQNLYDFLTSTKIAYCHILTPYYNTIYNRGEEVFEDAKFNVIEEVNIIGNSAIIKTSRILADNTLSKLPEFRQ